MMTVAFSCTDFVDPAIPYSGFETGLYLRTITAPTPINYFALSTETMTIEVEAVDAENGKTIQEVAVFVARRRGATVSTEASLTTIAGSSFAPTSESKYMRATISFSVSSAITAMGFTEADMNGGDFIEVRLAATDNQGRVFTNSNLSGDVASGDYYASSFFYRVGLVCPSNLGGTYSYVTTNFQCDNCPPSFPGVAGCGASVSGTGTLTDQGGGKYAVTDATFGQYACAWSDNPATGVVFNDACNKVSTSGTDQYGLVYTFTIIANDGASLTIDWANDYGDAGRTVLTRTDSRTWPLGLTN